MTMMAKKKKKKGRPSLLDLKKRSLRQQKQQQQLLSQSQNPNISSPRGTRVDSSEFVAGDEDDERKEKKHKLVLGFSSNPNSIPTTLSCRDDSDVSLRPRRISDISNDASEKLLKATENSVRHGSQGESGPTTPLPDKKLLVFILDRLQKKDTYGVFSSPVDPEELPGYHEIIANPMDFGTVRKKLDSGAYSTLEQFENDILLICSNAMEYNAADTIYFRQARSVQELAKKDFENLREESDDGEPPPPPKIVRRGRPPGKKAKNLPQTALYECVGPETVFKAAPPLVGDNSNESSGYNLRKGPMPNKFRPSDTINSVSHGSLATENCPSWVSEWENEFPSSVVRSVLKYGSKRYSVDENKRDSYIVPSASRDGPSTLALLDGELKHLVEVGDPYLECSYARSLAQFTAGLGPVVRKIAFKKIERIFPVELKASSKSSFLELKDLRNPAADDLKSIHLSQSTFGSSSVRGLENQIDLASLNSNAITSFQIQPNSFLQPFSNGNHIPRIQPQLGMLQPETSTGRVSKGEALASSGMLGGVSDETNLLGMTGRWGSGDFIHQGSSLGSTYRKPDEFGFEGEASSSMEGLHGPQTLFQSDINVGHQVASLPGSAVPISSPQQPDLALQLRMGW